MASKKKIEENGVEFNKESIEKELKEYVDVEITKKFDETFDINLRKEFYNEIEKSNKRMIREKNRTILFKNIIIIILFSIICFLVFLLFHEHYFDQFFGGSKEVEKEETVPNKVKKEEQEEKTEEKVEEETPTLDELILEYGSLLDDFQLSIDSSYLEEFYRGNMSNELKNYFSLNTIDFSKLEVEDNTNTFSSTLLMNRCREMFVDECVNGNFDYNQNKIRYFNKFDTYLSDNLLEKKSSIQREILDIVVEKDTVSIHTVEGIVLDDGVYSIVPNVVVNSSSNSLKENSEQLNHVVYVFQGTKLKTINKG